VLGAAMLRKRSWVGVAGPAAALAALLLELFKVRGTAAH
jgi:hypothetical protein